MGSLEGTCLQLLLLLLLHLCSLPRRYRLNFYPGIAGTPAEIEMVSAPLSAASPLATRSSTQSSVRLISGAGYIRGFSWTTYTWY